MNALGHTKDAASQFPMLRALLVPRDAPRGHRAYWTYPLINTVSTCKLHLSQLQHAIANLIHC